jgi:hypothetical protein
VSSVHLERAACSPLSPFLSFVAFPRAGRFDSSSQVADSG